MTKTKTKTKKGGATKLVLNHTQKAQLTSMGDFGLSLCHSILHPYRATYDQSGDIVYYTLVEEGRIDSIIFLQNIKNKLENTLAPNASLMAILDSQIRRQQALINLTIVTPTYDNFCCSKETIVAILYAAFYTGELHNYLSQGMGEVLTKIFAAADANAE